MKMDEVRAMKTDELHVELERLRRHLFELRAQSVTEKLEDPSQLGKTKHDIARLLTELHQRGERNIEQRQAHMSATGAKR